MFFSRVCLLGLSALSWANSCVIGPIKEIYVPFTDVQQLQLHIKAQK